MKTAGQLGIVALVALALTALPGGGSALNVAVAMLTIAFLTVLAVLGYRLYGQLRFQLDSLEDRHRLVLYGSLGLALLTFSATGRLFDSGGAGTLVWIALLALCSFGVYWVWTQYRSYA